MDVIKNIIELLFSTALFINAMLFIPQVKRIFTHKNSKDISLITFSGFLLIQLATVLHGYIIKDYILIIGYILSMITCGMVVGAAIYYRYNNNEFAEINFEKIIENLPWHVYWKDKEGILKGSNTKNWQDLGLNSLEEFVGKTDYDFLIKEQADKIRAADIKAMKLEKPLILEEEVTLQNNKKTLFLSYKLPLKNHLNEIVGILGVSLDITDTRKQELERLELLENVIALTPGHVYWVNKDNVYLGCNNNQAISAGLQSRKDIVGKRNHDLPWNMRFPGLAKKLDNANNQVIQTGTPLLIEEPAILPDGSERIFLSNKVPLLNSTEKIIGLVGISLDITQQKEIEKLNLKAKEQTKFLKIANQVAHDIRSPLSSLLMIVKSCNEIPEQYRIALREAAVSIGDIANNLLNTYKNPIASENQEQDKAKAVLVSALLLEVLTEKKYQYHDLPVKFDYDFTSESHFAFIHIRASAFRRMISNLINNAVEAFDEKPGKILLKLNADNEWLKIIVEDNGKGISIEVLDKILKNIAITAGKTEGHGIGLTQVHETLQAYQGEMSIESALNKGTQIILSFPRMTSPSWIADKIQLFDNDIVVILDDDASIHGAWDTHFNHVLKQYPAIELQHFDRGDNALHFIDHLSEADKQRVFLLTDFELLKQELTGLQVVEQSQIQRSILVTSHYMNKQILQQATNTNTKILPKQLASEIPITIDKRIASKQETSTTVDFIVLDDDETFTDMLDMFMFSDYKVDYYHQPEQFLKNIQQYQKNIKIYIDGHFQGSSLNGLAVAKHLHEQGFTRLYLLSGEKPKQAPAYLTVILKDDLDRIQSSLNEE